jgi:cytosine deaminase
MLTNLKYKIKAAGGFVNSHAHFDRSYTHYDFENHKAYAPLMEKWKLVDDYKASSDVFSYYNNIKQSIDTQKHFGVTKACTFVDIDSIVGTKALQAARIIKKQLLDENFKLKIACQTLKGVLNNNESSLIESSMENIDIIGSLPRSDEDPGLHIDKVMSWAKKYDKRLHVHVDQLNCPSEKETELLARKTIEWGLEGRVTAIHSISLACHPESYRKEVYKICKDASLHFITCPSAWIDHPRREDLAPIHNAITPVEEIIAHDLVVGIGSDNINDIYKPYSDGDMMFELRLLLEACKIYDEEVLIKIATSNGNRICGF